MSNLGDYLRAVRARCRWTVDDLLESCICMPAYKDRGLIQPDCVRCAVGDEMELVLLDRKRLLALAEAGERLAEALRNDPNDVGVKTVYALNEWDAAAREATGEA